MISELRGVDIPERGVVFHAINQIGLGHLSRLSAIALALRDRALGLPITFIVDGSSHGLLEAAGLSYVGLSMFGNHDQPGSFSQKQRARLMFSFASSLLEIARPRLVVFDTFPNGALVAAAQKREIPLAICLRKMKKMRPEFTQFPPAMRAFSTILLPHAPGEMEVPEDFAAITHMVGTIARPLSTATRAAAPDVLISGGGGGYPGTVSFYNAALEAFADLRRERPELTGVLVTGPLFQEWERLQPVERVQIMPFDPDLTATFGRSRLVVCQAGYNTIAEIVGLKVPVVCVPAERRADDQFERAVQVAKTHPQVQVCLKPDGQVMRAMMLRGLDMPKGTGEIATPAGAGLAAQHLLDAMAAAG